MMPSWIEVATSSLKQKKDIHEKWMKTLKDTRRPKVISRPLFLLSLEGKSNSISRKNGAEKEF